MTTEAPLTVWLNAINFRQCTVELFRTGKVMRVVDYVFHADLIGDASIFHQRGIPTTVFCTDRLRTVLEADLVGARFSLLWDSEQAEAS